MLTETDLYQIFPRTQELDDFLFDFAGDALRIIRPEILQTIEQFHKGSIGYLPISWQDTPVGDLLNFAWATSSLGNIAPAVSQLYLPGMGVVVGLRRLNAKQWTYAVATQDYASMTRGTEPRFFSELANYNSLYKDLPNVVYVDEKLAIAINTQGHEEDPLVVCQYFANVADTVRVREECKISEMMHSSVIPTRVQHLILALGWDGSLEIDNPLDDIVKGI